MLYEVPFEFWHVPVILTSILLSFTSILSGATGLSQQINEQAKIKMPQIMEIALGGKKNNSGILQTP